jgi:hypothetical protein
MEPRSISHISRTDLLYRCSSAFIASSLFPVAAQANVFQMPIDITLKVGDAQATAKFIEINCRDMLAAARETGRVLYRGYNDMRSVDSFVVTEKSDLSDPSTYGSLLSTEYFSALEAYLTSKDSPCIPSSGHIATPSSMAALQWGTVVGVWPLDELHYVWLRDKVCIQWNMIARPMIYATFYMCIIKQFRAMHYFGGKNGVASLQRALDQRLSSGETKTICEPSVNRM